MEQSQEQEQEQEQEQAEEQRADVAVLRRHVLCGRREPRRRRRHVLCGDSVRSNSSYDELQDK